LLQRARLISALSAKTKIFLTAVSQQQNEPMNTLISCF
jgi:hypothetical protein